MKTCKCGLELSLDNFEKTSYILKNEYNKLFYIENKEFIYIEELY